MSKKNRNQSFTRVGTGPATVGSLAEVGHLPEKGTAYAFTREQIEIAAEAAHEANRQYCRDLGDASQVPWSEAPQWQKDSAINGVTFAIENNFPLGRDMHENWMKEKLAAGWVYGPEKNADLTIGPLTHPCLVPYDELPVAQQCKDDLFRNTIRLVLLGPPGSIESPLPPDQLPVAGEAEGFATEAATEEEILDLDNPEDGDENAPIQTIFEREWNLCLSLAFSGTGLDMLTDWGSVPFELWRFINDNKDAPDDAVLIHIRRKMKVAILPNDDPRRVHLAIQLFRQVLIAMQKIETEDHEAAVLAHRQALAAEAGAPRIDPEDQTFATEKGPFDEMSDLGKSLSQKAD